MNTSQLQPDNLSDTDRDLLSAYLDNQLSVPERVTLERRLQAEPALQRELVDLRATVSLLQSLEPLPLPRSFTIDPAKAPRRAFVFPFAFVMQFGSGFAGLALVLLASIQLLFGGTQASETFSSMSSGLSNEPAMSAPMAAATEAPAAESSMAAEADPEAMTAPQESAAAPAPSDLRIDPAADQAAGSGPALPPNAGGPPSIDATAPKIDASDTSSPDTMQLPATAPAAAPAQPAITPGWLMFFGVLLLAIASGIYSYQRRRGGW